MFQIEPLLETFEGLFNTPALVEEVAKARRREKLPPGKEDAVGVGSFGQMATSQAQLASMGMRP